jgi:hypothetical protein
MPDLSLLVPILLAARIGLDLVAIANRGTSYQLELAYFLVFAAAAAALLVTDIGDGWGWLAAVIAAYSLAAFFLKRAKRERQNAESAT